MTELEALRAAFDDAFRHPPPAPPDVAPMVVVRVGSRPFALRRSDVDRIVADRPVTRVPGAPPALLGLATLRGAVLPVWSLAALLGLPGEGAPRWLAVRRGAGFGFGELVGLRDAPGDVGAHWETPDGVLPVVDLGQIVARGNGGSR